MVFSVYSATTNQLIVEIDENGATYIAPGFQKPLSKIPAESCFSIYIEGERERKFGKVNEIEKDDPLYPKALKMYCEAQLLTHPESYTTKKSHPLSSD